MPEPFPGIHGCPATKLPSFVVTEGLPAEYHHMVTLSRALGIAIDAATLLTNAPTPELQADHFGRIGLAKAVLTCTLKTIENVEAWSKQNLEPPKKQAAPKHESTTHEPPKHGPMSTESHVTSHGLPPKEEPLHEATKHASHAGPTHPPSKSHG